MLFVMLFTLLRCLPQKVKATFLLSGWAAGEDGGEARHVVRLVEGQQVRVLCRSYFRIYSCACMFSR